MQNNQLHLGLISYKHNYRKGPRLGFNVYRADQNRHGGGLLVVIVKSFQSIRQFDLERPEVELLWIQVFYGT